MTQSAPTNPKAKNFSKLRDRKDRMSKVAKPRHSEGDTDGRTMAKGDKFDSKVKRSKRGDNVG